MPEENVIVEEVRPAEVTKPKALRIFVGKFIVDFIETLSIALPVGALFLPASMEDVNKLFVILSVPIGSSFVSAGRRGWPTLKKWLNPEAE